MKHIEFWKTMVKGNGFLLFVAFVMNLVLNDGNAVTNHLHFSYWYVIGTTFATVMSLIILLIVWLSKKL